jgi:membrane protein YqaA with SNARE-associated domain
MLEYELGYLGLFLTSFLAATFIPFPSEIVLFTMLGMEFNPINCLLLASVGNSLGSYLNYCIGYLGNPKWLKKIGVKESRINEWSEKIKKHGVWLAFFSWLPFIGHILSTSLGFFKVSISLSFLFIFIGKFSRYLVLSLYFFL